MLLNQIQQWKRDSQLTRRQYNSAFHDDQHITRTLTPNFLQLQTPPHLMRQKTNQRTQDSFSAGLTSSGSSCFMDSVKSQNLLQNSSVALHQESTRTHLQVPSTSRVGDHQISAFLRSLAINNDDNWRSTPPPHSTRAIPDGIVTPAIVRPSTLAPVPQIAPPFARQLSNATAVVGSTSALASVVGATPSPPYARSGMSQLSPERREHQVIGT